MEQIWIGLLLVSILIVWFYIPKKEDMTNKDLLATLSRFGKTGTKSPDASQEEIYGPKVPQAEEPSPTPASGKSVNDTNIYPDIYGPEVTPVPGMKKSKSKSKSKSNVSHHTGSRSGGTHSDMQGGLHSSDTVEDDSYEFNPDFRKAFPVDDDEPQPFLTDFSKFQH
jgi:hypothetical protein